ncbi:hypothetical protein DUNSADRAFT_12570 [Dunaliella salina]|uniref:Secreted protein n=1 Tax=Dunaliella salina TaxID=3046 RepID=A0ABQ7GB29_DUNSA|nr:hypothetical protein DUNSADRAFT_12570 [Dunaliella salina]|eukprot:KAF5831802.1 hypothetical protein DUNSADRAFT_12570 [Dunaliella salina]
MMPRQLMLAFCHALAQCTSVYDDVPDHTCAGATDQSLSFRHHVEGLIIEREGLKPIRTNWAHFASGNRCQVINFIFSFTN